MNLSKFLKYLYIAEPKEMGKIYLNDMMISLGILSLSLFPFTTISCSQSSNSSADEVSTVDSYKYTGLAYIDNGKVRIGVDLNKGGCVFFFSESTTQRNLLNHHDEGRFMQQSYYGEPDGSTFMGKSWVWNPIQGGCNGVYGRIISKEITKDSIHIVSEPVSWGSAKRVTECQMEETITLKDKLAHIHYTFRNTGEGAKDHPSTSQELPAVFVDYNLPNLVYYTGQKPWTNDELTSQVPGWPNEGRNRTEEWAAYVDSNQWGIGVYTPGTPASTTYRYKGAGTTGDIGDACSYFAPVRNFAITKGLVFEYDVYLYIGTVTDIRTAFYAVHDAGK
jgi:hypothetical protein